MTKLMDFTLGVMSQAAQPWRLVVGRIGRIGHGELKGTCDINIEKCLVLNIPCPFKKRKNNKKTLTFGRIPVRNYVYDLNSFALQIIE